MPPPSEPGQSRVEDEHHEAGGQHDRRQRQLLAGDPRSFLLAEARNLRNAELSDQQEKAGVAGEQLTLPAIVLALGFIMLVLYPALTRF